MDSNFALLFLADHGSDNIPSVHNTTVLPVSELGSKPTIFLNSPLTHTPRVPEYPGNFTFKIDLKSDRFSPAVTTSSTSGHHHLLIFFQDYCFRLHLSSLMIHNKPLCHNQNGSVKRFKSDLFGSKLPLVLVVTGKNNFMSTVVCIVEHLATFLRNLYHLPLTRP